MANTNSAIFKSLLTIWSYFILIIGKILFLLPSQKSYKNLRTTLPQCPQKGILFFCSSAGEYEQAKPIIKRLQSLQIPVVIIFFSPSGYKFAQARKEIAPYYLCPVDTIWNWEKWLSKIQPRATIVVRHELWPSFLSIAKQYGPVFLINATQSGGRSNWLKTQTKSFLYQFFTQIFVVNESDIEYFKNLECTSLQTVGDTKYDQVFDRKNQIPPHSLKITSSLKEHCNQTQFLTIGSAWPLDLKIVLESYKNFDEKPSILCIPHDLSAKNIFDLEQICKQYDISFLSITEAPHEPIAATVIIIKTMGILANIYALSDAVFVGGASHHQVHNVLEPAVHLVPIAFGHKYHNSAEAIELVQHSFATVINTPTDLSTWWNQKSSYPQEKLHQHLQKWVGASNKVLSFLQQNVLIAHPNPSNNEIH